MRCDRCSAEIEDGEERELNGWILSDDCFIDLISHIPYEGTRPMGSIYSALFE